MIVKELIEELQKMPQDSLVLVDVEYGYDRAGPVQTINARKRPFVEDWNSEYGYEDDEKAGEEIIPAVYFESHRMGSL